MNIRDCDGCKHFTKYYGNKNKVGKRTVSNYWCVRKNGFIRSFPKKCLFKPKEEKGGRVMPMYGEEFPQMQPRPDNGADRRD